MTGHGVGALHLAGDAADRPYSHEAARERASLRLPAVRGLRAASAGVHAEALRRLSAPLGDRFDASGGHISSDARRVPLDARLVAVATEASPGDSSIPRAEVLVEVQGVVVGRLPEGHAPLWHPPLTRAQEDGVEVTCGAMLTLPSAANAAPVLSLRVCEPEHLRLMLTTPDWALPLVPECSVTLSGARISNDLIAQVTRRMVDWVTLHPVTIGDGRHAGAPGVEVRLEGQRIGEFSAAASARYRPVVDAAARNSKTPLARARLRDDERGIELDVLLPRPA